MLIILFCQYKMIVESSEISQVFTFFYTSSHENCSSLFIFKQKIFKFFQRPLSKFFRILCFIYVAFVWKFNIYRIFGGQFFSIFLALVATPDIFFPAANKIRNGPCWICSSKNSSKNSF